LEVEEDFLLTGSRFALTRQFESVQAALELAKITLGHLSVSFIRPALEEYLWLKYLAGLDRSIASYFYLILGIRDVLRSVEATDEYIGDEGMAKVGFPPNFTASVGKWLAETKRRARTFNQQLVLQP
jgi:hypothetical protein